MSAVLDASACLAYLQGESGTAVVAEVLTHGAYISAVNLAEVLSKLSEWGREPQEAYTEMINRGFLGRIAKRDPGIPSFAAGLERSIPGR